MNIGRLLHAMKHFSVLAITSCIVLAGQAVAHDDGTVHSHPDHYLSYEIQVKQFHPAQVFLWDQFIQGSFFVVKPVRLLNPVAKEHGGNKVEIQNRRLHYVSYELKIEELDPPTPFLPKTVRIDNQFESREVTVESFPDRLLSPAAKRHKKPVIIAKPVKGVGRRGAVPDFTIPKFEIPDGNHYLCYPIIESNTFTAGVALKDQFRERDAKISGITRLCNPVIKLHNNEFFPADIDNPGNHLTCYKLDKTDIARKVVLKDQFGVKLARVIFDDELCVPTVKLDLDVPCAANSAGMCPADATCEVGQKCELTAVGSCKCQ